MIDLTIFTLSLTGFAALLLAMARHQQDWLGRKLPPPRSRLLRGIGFTQLALGFLCAGAGLGWAYGAVAWLGWLTLAAAAIVALHTNRERIMRRIRS